MQEVAAFAADGGLVLGICNGFQILTEAHLLHGALRRNRGLRFICHPQYLRVERTDTPFTRRLKVGQVIQVPVNHNEGNWTAGAESLQADRGAAGWWPSVTATPRATSPTRPTPTGPPTTWPASVNEGHNVLGMMPHPERVCEEILGGIDGRADLRVADRSRARGGVSDGRGDRPSARAVARETRFLHGIPSRDLRLPGVPEPARLAGDPRAAARTAGRLRMPESERRRRDQLGRRGPDRRAAQAEPRPDA